MAGALLLLAGCGDEPAAAPAPLDKKPAATTSPTPTAVAPPALPAEAQGASNAAAVAFVEHYIDVLNYTAATLDTTALDDLSTVDCDGCAGILKRISRFRERGGSVQGGAWSVLESVPQSVIGAADARVQVFFDRAAETAIPSAGETPIKYPAGNAVLLFDLQIVDSGWAIRAIERVDE